MFYIEKEAGSIDEKIMMIKEEIHFTNLKLNHIKKYLIGCRFKREKGVRFVDLWEDDVKGFLKFYGKKLKEYENALLYYENEKAGKY